MKELDKTKVYSLKDLTSEELKEIYNATFTPSKRYKFLYFEGYQYHYSDDDFHKPTHNAKELFYTLENIQVDCRDLTEEQIEEMADVFKANGYKIWNYQKALNVSDVNYLLEFSGREVFVSIGSEEKTTITYEKFMELFAPQHEVTEKPKHYSKGIDTFARMEANCTKEEIFNPQQHYFNEPKQFRSLFELSHILELNEWEFDVLKRLVRCRKKNQFKEDLQKIKDTIDIYLKEYES